MKQQESSRQSKKGLAEDRTEWAEERTNWAHERTLLAKERTFAAWARTGTAAMAAGLGIARLIEVADAAWIVRAIGVVLILTGGSIFVVGFVSYRKALQKLSEEGIRGMSIWVVGVLTFGLIVSAALALWLIFIE